MGSGQPRRNSLCIKQELEKNINLKYLNLIDNQAVKLYSSNKLVYSSGKLKKGQTIEASVPIEMRVGKNDLRFSFDKWNFKDEASTFVPNDIRHLSVMFTRLDFGDVDSVSGDDLFGNDAPQITLVGSSYSKYMNLADLLKSTTKSDVLDANQVGKGFLLPMSEYIKH